MIVGYFERMSQGKEEKDECGRFRKKDTRKRMKGRLWEI